MLRLLLSPIAIVLLFIGLSAPLQAQTAQRCFPETGFCISGRIREFWERNGGLRVFGYPITPLQLETIDGQAVQAQWFERHRLELHPANRRPYDVQIGRLGSDLLERQGRDWRTFPVNTAGGACRAFGETGRTVCGPILAAWRANGLELDGRTGVNEAESLALFGLPLSDLQDETLSDGRSYQVQWFERARFEIHPTSSGGTQVLFGLLGREFGPPVGTTINVPPAAAPLRMAIPKIGLDQGIVSVGLDREGYPIVPDHDIGWYNRSARPGEGENIVFWGHVLRFSHAPQIPAPFARIKQLVPGDRISLFDAAGAEHTYIVRQQVWAKPEEVRYILPLGRERVTLVSCIGNQVIVGNEVVDMTHRLITIAEPAP